MQSLGLFPFYDVLLKIRVEKVRLFYSVVRLFCSFSGHIEHTEGSFLMEKPSYSVGLKTLCAALDHPKPMG